MPVEITARTTVSLSSYTSSSITVSVIISSVSRAEKVTVPLVKLKSSGSSLVAPAVLLAVPPVETS